jgi:hypothetical protein
MRSAALVAALTLLATGLFDTAAAQKKKSDAKPKMRVEHDLLGEKVVR